MALRLMVISCRKEAGLSQGELANALGWSQQSVSDLETGRRGLDMREVPDLAKAFRMKPAKLFKLFMIHLES
ncbi:MAG TPA: helix-turn-helix transcriptional regulator [Gemmatimonadales bacterium]|jgi:transcriptional regulator with XRE-family HTH domain